MVVGISGNKSISNWECRVDAVVKELSKWFLCLIQEAVDTQEEEELAPN